MSQNKGLGTPALAQLTASTALWGGNSTWVEDLYERYLAGEAVPDDWQKYFSTLAVSRGDVPHGPIVRSLAERAQQPRTVVATHSSDAGGEKQAAVSRLIQIYTNRGHLIAKVDPLGLMQRATPRVMQLDYMGLSEADFDTEFYTGTRLEALPRRAKLREIVAMLDQVFAGPIGAEFAHVSDTDERLWLQDQFMLGRLQQQFSKEEKLTILRQLTAAEGLERYLHTKYVGQKRFSLEGGDALIPLLDTVVRQSGIDQVKDIVIGMAHRGRLNVLVNTLGKNPRRLFDEFEGKFEHDERAHAGDVKYHMGFSADIATPGVPVHLALAFNPSHLEIVDPVVAGSVRSRQERRGDAERRQVMPVLIHGDAAFAGQGVVMELLQMSQARGFAVGGTLHVVVNNQVGFTTSNKEDARSTLYCTDVAKMVGAPVFHVNGDDPEAVAFVARLAYQFRQEFSKDVVIDLVCYRRHGHNEADEPAATQPVMYQTIRKHPTTRELYAAQLEKAGVLSADDARALVDGYRNKLDAGEFTTELAPAKAEDYELTIDWSKYLSGTLADPVDTRVKKATLTRLAKLINTIPAGVALHPRVAKIYDDRLKMTAGEIGGDWGFAENLAYATLLAEGNGLRLVGQDAGRGTFFHRHAILHDQKTDSYYLPLRQLVENPEDATIIDSLLSEEAVMAFEYGYSTTDPDTLDIWEAQFGDFANGAQVVIDQFIAAGEAKWGRISGLTLLLPHGYEGQGPEHSSARLERFLQLCALENMLVCVPTTPAQAFHMIRRQLRMTTRKPLIVMTPKSLLRHKLAVSSLDELANGEFQHLIPDAAANPKKVKRVVLCSGKVYYDLLEDQHKRGQDNVAIVRIEQLYPFPRTLLAAELKRYAAAKEVVWCQEEPQNQGAWYQIRHHLKACTTDKQELYYAGRARSPSPAAGHFAQHVEEQLKLVADALVNPFGNDIDAE